ncbi:MAG: hypothetical protein ACSHYF_13170 [Verrucomicrobiaceae bacterium]
MSNLLDSGEGQLISLRAPRAGYGKTMLLSRLRQSRQAQALFVPVHLADGRRVEGEVILEEILTLMAEVLPAGGGLTRLDLHTRNLFAQGLMPLVYSGEVPCQDRDGALVSLRDRPTEAFDFHHEGAAIAQWSREQFGLLGPRLSAVLSKASGTSGRDVGYWADLFFNYAIRPPSDVARTADLMDAVFGPKSRFHTGAGFLEGLGSFLNLITLVEPVILVLDEVEGLSSDSDAALRAASCLTSLWEAAPRLSVILSVNDDVWESAFVPRLPLGLRDRLEDVVVRLNPLSEDEAKALITVRAGDEASKIIDRIDFKDGHLYPRGVLREARDLWDRRDEAIPTKEVSELSASRGEESEKEESTGSEEYIPEAAEQPVGTSEVAPDPDQNAGVSPPRFGTHPSRKIDDDLLDDELEGGDFANPAPVQSQPTPGANPFAQASPFAVAAAESTGNQGFEREAEAVKAPKVEYPPAPVKRVTMPRRFPVQRLIPGITRRQEAVGHQPVASPAEAVPAYPSNPAPISPFTNAPVSDAAHQQALPTAGPDQPAAPIASPFSINPSPVPPPQPAPAAPQGPPPISQSPFGMVEQVQQVQPQQQPVQAVPPNPFGPPQGQAQAPPPSQQDRLAENADAIDDLLRQFRSRNED